MLCIFIDRVICVAWMSAGQEDIDLEMLDEGVGDSVEETNVMLEGQVNLVVSTID